LVDVAAAKISTFASFSTDQTSALTNEQILKLSAAQLLTVPEANVAKLTAAQISDNVKVLPGLTQTYIDSLSDDAVAAITSTQIAKLATTTLESLTVNQAFSFGTEVEEWAAAKGYTVISKDAGTDVKGIDVDTTITAIAGSTVTAGKLAVAVTGTASAETIVGSSLADTITSGGATDSISAGAGNDTINAATDAYAVVDGGEGTDTLAITTAFDPASTDTLIVNVENVTITGASALTVDLTGQTDAFAITLSGAAGHTVTGGAGADSITGSTVADTITGGAGADTITGGLGIDNLTGGTEADTFVFAAVATAADASAATDVITDFTTGSDKLSLGTAATALAVKEVFTVTYTAAGFASGETITFGGVTHTGGSAGTLAIAAVATALDAAADWAVTGSGTTLTFTATKPGAVTDATTASFTGTGADTITALTVGTQGVDGNYFEGATVASVAAAITAAQVADVMYFFAYDGSANGYLVVDTATSSDSTGTNQIIQLTGIDATEIAYTDIIA